MWLRARGTYSASSGHVGMDIYGIGERVLQASRNGHKKILRWIHANGSPCDCVEYVIYIKWNRWKKEEECNICFEELDESTVKFVSCTHHYHKECMDTMLETRGVKKGCSICQRGK